MGSVREIPLVDRVDARIKVPGSKSITNRALVCAALANGTSLIENASDSDDSVLMMNGLNQLGVLARRQGDAVAVEGKGGKLFAPKFPIPVGNAGTTLRFLLSLAGLAQGSVVFQGEQRMAERPNDELFEALRILGVGVEQSQHAPIYTVSGGNLRGGAVHLRGDKSSQFLSSLLMVAPYASRDVDIVIEGGLISAPFVEMTVTVMRRFGVEARRETGGRFVVHSGVQYRPQRFFVETDASGASYFLAAAAVTGGTVMIEGLRQDSVQGDARFLDVLREMGSHYEETAEGVMLVSGPRLGGVDIDMNAMPDMVPTLVATALFADGETRIRNVGHLKYKESDRAEALVTELHKLGAEIRRLEDTLTVCPTKLHGGQLDSRDDHRLAMAFAVIGLRVPGIRIEQPECVKKSFPGFWKEFDKLYRS